VEALCDLLFELSNEDRLLILIELKKSPLKLSQISRNLGFTVQGTSRNVARLVEASLIERNIDGNYKLTSYGKNALLLTTSYEFLSKHMDYFLSHSTEWLPTSYIARIGELRNCERVNEYIDVITNIQKELKDAEEYQWYIAPGRIVSHSDLSSVTDSLERGINVRAIEPTGYRPSDRTIDEVPIEVREYLEEKWRAGKLETRHLDEINIRMYMTDKEVAILALPKLDGKVDLLGFHSKDPLFHSWCKELYEYYWNQAKQVPWFWTDLNQSGMPTYFSK
jgi:predicted transcriptional regulator